MSKSSFKELFDVSGPANPLAGDWSPLVKLGSFRIALTACQREQFLTLITYGGHCLVFVFEF